MRPLQTSRKDVFGQGTGSEGGDNLLESRALGVPDQDVGWENEERQSWAWATAETKLVFTTTHKIKEQKAEWQNREFGFKHLKFVITTRCI